MMRGIAIVALAVSVFSGCDAMLFDCEERVVGDTYFTGRVNKLTRDATYISMYFKPTAHASAVPGPALVRVGTRTASLRGVTPQALLDTGFPRVSAHPTYPAFGTHCPNAETGGAGVGIGFADNHLVNVYANNAFRESCDFSVSWEGHEPISFPIDSRELIPRLPEAGVLQACRSLF